MRGAGVGEGDGVGVCAGAGLGVCAKDDKGNDEAVRPATPNAGSVLTKVRRSSFCLRWRFALFFISVSPLHLIIVPVPTPWVLRAPYFTFKTFALPNL